jgi:hypothetical protein
MQMLAGEDTLVQRWVPVPQTTLDSIVKPLGFHDESLNPWERDHFAQGVAVRQSSDPVVQPRGENAVGDVQAAWVKREEQGIVARDAQCRHPLILRVADGQSGLKWLSGRDTPQLDGRRRTQVLDSD